MRYTPWSVHFIANESTSDMKPTCQYMSFHYTASKHKDMVRLSGNNDCTHFRNKDIRLLGFMPYILSLLDTFLVYDHNCGIYYVHCQCLYMCWTWTLILGTAVYMWPASTYDMNII
jgi:hypothetical protein